MGTIKLWPFLNREGNKFGEELGEEKMVGLGWSRMIKESEFGLGFE